MGLMKYNHSPITNWICAAVAANTRDVLSIGVKEDLSIRPRYARKSANNKVNKTNQRISECNARRNKYINGVVLG